MVVVAGHARFAHQMVSLRLALPRNKVCVSLCLMNNTSAAILRQYSAGRAAWDLFHFQYTLFTDTCTHMSIGIKPAQQNYGGA